LYQGLQGFAIKLVEKILKECFISKNIGAILVPKSLSKPQKISKNIKNKNTFKCSSINSFKLFY